MKKLLFLSRWYPYPFDNGAKIRIYNLLRELSRSFTIDLISFSADRVNDKQKSHMLKYCHSVKSVVFQYTPPTNWISILKGFLSYMPRYYYHAFNPELMNYVKNAVKNEDYDVVLASEIDMALYAYPLNAGMKVLEELELTTRYEQYLNQKTPIKKILSGLSWWKTTRFVKFLFKHFDGCTVVSELERELIQSVMPRNKHLVVIPNGVDVSYYDQDFGEVEPNTLVYSGSITFYPNYDAVNYFLQDIFPEISKEIPDVNLYVTGGLGNVQASDMTDLENVHFTGRLEDIRPRLTNSCVCVVPLRYGGGTRLKVLEALAAGVPTVTTEKGAEGLDLVNGVDLLISSEPQDFAQNVIQILNDPQLGRKLIENGKRSVSEKYDWAIIGSKLVSYIDKLLVKDP